MERLVELNSAFLVKIDNSLQLKKLKQVIEESLGMPSFYITAGLIVPIKKDYLSPSNEEEKKKIKKVITDWLSEEFEK